MNLSLLNRGKERVMVGYVITFSTPQKCLTDLSLSALFPHRHLCTHINPFLQSL
jgi:hypothetical protein